MFSCVNHWQNYMKITNDAAILSISPDTRLLEHPDFDVGTITGTPALWNLLPVSVEVIVYLLCNNTILFLHKQLNRNCHHSANTQKSPLERCF